jgi:hypothetical protein
MMVEQRGSMVEAAGMPGIVEGESMKVQMMAELVAQRAQERTE